MTVGLVVPFIHYPGTTKETSKALYDYFMRYARKLKHVDHFYIIDSGGFTGAEPDENTHVFTRPIDSHWANLNEVLPLVTEDIVLLVDSDTILYDRNILSIIKGYYQNGMEIVTGVDTSGGIEVTNPDMHGFRRFTPYFFSCLKRVLPDRFDFTPTSGENWTDSMGMITLQMLEKNPKLDAFNDDRTSVIAQDSGGARLDDPFGQRSYFPGYYHIRNVGQGLRLADATDRDVFRELVNPMPRWEAIRLLLWAEKILGWKHTDHVAEYMLIEPEEWENLKRLHMELHRWA